MSVGKRFEYDLRAGLRLMYPNGFVERITDRMVRGSVSVQSPPDLIAIAAKRALLIECKVVKGKSLPFNRLSDHQLEYLQRFDSISSKHQGAIAVMFYNGLKGKASIRRAWLIPIGEWVSLLRKIGRAHV